MVYRSYVGECRVGLHYHVSCGQGARVGVTLLGLDLFRFDDHLRNTVIAHHSRHRGLQLVYDGSSRIIYHYYTTDITLQSLQQYSIPGPLSGDVQISRNRIFLSAAVAPGLRCTAVSWGCGQGPRTGSSCCQSFRSSTLACRCHLRSCGRSLGTGRSC